MRAWIGAALALPWVFLSLVPNVAEAKGRAAVIFQMSSHTVQAGQAFRVQASATGISGPVEYAVWIKWPNGHWQALKRMGPERRMALKISKPGTYRIQVRAMSREALWKHQWRDTVNGTPEVIYVGATPVLTASAHSVPIGGSVSLKAKDPAIPQPLFQFRVKTPKGTWITTPWEKAAKAQETWSTPGAYDAVVAVKATGGPAIESSPVAFTVYGPATHLAFQPSRSTWVADGKETETVSVKALDAEGDTVSNLNGSGTLTDTRGAGAISAWGSHASSLEGLYSPLPLTFKNGVARVTLQAGSVVGSDRLTAATTNVAGSGALTGTTTIKTVAQQASAIQLAALNSYLIANESANEADYRVAVVDQVGEPMLSGTYSLSATIKGPAQFEGFGQGPNTVTYTGGAGATPLAIYSVAAETGQVTLVLSYHGLKPASSSLPAVLGGQPYRMGVSTSTPTLATGQSATLTLTQVPKNGGLPDPASLDNSAYVVGITDKNGNPAAGFDLAGAPYYQPVSFSVATGPNEFYAVSQTVSLTDVSAAAGQYDIVVSDGDGLWKPSVPLEVTIR